MYEAPFDERENCFVFILYVTETEPEGLLPAQSCAVDLNARNVSVRQVVTFPENSAVVRPYAKTEKSIRAVPLPASLIDRIRPWYNVRTMSGAAAEELLFPNVSKSVYVRFWNKIRQKLGRPELTAHWFRHNYATQLYYSDVSIKQAVALLGHSGTKMIMEVYAHLDEQKESVRDKLDALFT